MNGTKTTTKINLSIGEDACHVLCLALQTFMDQPQEISTRGDFEIAQGLLTEIECLAAEMFND